MGNKVLVTGAGGFIGSHLTETLLQEGHEVRALVHYNSRSDWGWLQPDEYVEVMAGDIRDPELCIKASKGVDAVFNLAALIAIPYSYQAVHSYAATNITGTVNLLNASLFNGVSKFIQMSTSEVYGTAKYVPIDENHPLQPQSPYSATKIGSDAIAMSYYNTFELPVTIARPFNTYGPRQSARAIIPAVLVQLLSGANAIKLGDVTPTRDFNYVTDTCASLVKLSENSNAEGEIVNIGSNTEISVLGVVQEMMRQIGVDVPIEVDNQRIRPAGSEVHRLVCENTKMKKYIGNMQQTKISEGIRRTIEWFKIEENLKKYHHTIYNR